MFLEEYYEGKLFLIDKPLGWTSFDVVNKLKLTLNKHREKQEPRVKVGHAGTLDPLATGLLLVATGKMTKSIEGLQGMPKVYTGTIKLGHTTPSLDGETPEEGPFPIDRLTDQVLEGARCQFVGEIQQAPPLFSAIWHQGERLYEKARRGEEMEVKTRQVVVHSFALGTYRAPFLPFEVMCSKGTYIRSLARDFGLACGTRAYLSELRRTKIGNYDVAASCGPEAAAEQIRKEFEARGGA